jgi:hypothetical protein
MSYLLQDLKRMECGRCKKTLATVNEFLFYIKGEKVTGTHIKLILLAIKPIEPCSSWHEANHKGESVGGGGLE